MPILDTVNLALAARSAPDAFAELQRSLTGTSGVEDGAEFLRAVTERHKLGETCLDGEVAIPHVRTSAVSRIVVAAGRSATGIYFNALASHVRLVFLIGVPPTMGAEYLRTLAEIARIVREPRRRRWLLEAPTASDFQAGWANSPARTFPAGRRWTA